MFFGRLLCGRVRGRDGLHIDIGIVVVVHSRGVRSTIGLISFARLFVVGRHDGCSLKIPNECVYGETFFRRRSYSFIACTGQCMVCTRSTSVLDYAVPKWRKWRILLLLL